MFCLSVRFKCAILLFFLLDAVSVSAGIILTAGDLAIEIASNRGWTVKDITKNNRKICDGHIGSAQGTVMRVDGVWSGSGHANEKLLDYKLYIDGIEQPFTDGLSYNGNYIEVSRMSIIADAYLLTSVMTITPDFTNERVKFHGLDSSKDCGVFYGFLGTRANRLTQYTAFDSLGSLLYDGQNDKNDGSSVYFGTAQAVAQYDPFEGDGVLSVITNDSGIGLESFIWDRSYDNKLYFRFVGAEGHAGTTNFFEFNQSLRFFEADRQEWQKTAELLIQQPLPEPSTIFMLFLGGLALLKRRSS